MAVVPAGMAPVDLFFDNIDDSGPHGPDDEQFATKFENPNAGLDFPWAMVLGNHDTSSVFPGDGGWLARGNFEVAYHAKSPRWWMPSRYYSVRVPEQNPVVEFFVLDINPLAAYIPPFLDPYWAVDGPYMNEQRAWLDTALAESTAQWKIACRWIWILMVEVSAAPRSIRIECTMKTK